VGGVQISSKEQDDGTQGNHVDSGQCRKKQTDDKSSKKEEDSEGIGCQKDKAFEE